MKICTKCKELKPKSEFNNKAGRKDNLNSNCKTCLNLYYQKNLEKILKKSKTYYDTNKEQIAVTLKLYRQVNKEQISKAFKLYRENNIEKITMAKKEYYKNNVEKITIRKKEYYKNNPDKNAARHHKRRALKAKSGGTYTSNDIQTLLLDQQGHCRYCKDALILQGKGKFHVDHRMPLFLGGTNSPDNLQLLCPTCNLTKSAIHPDIYESQIYFKLDVDTTKGV